MAPNPFRPPTAAELFAPLSARLALTTLEIHASPQWSSRSPDYRELLRAAVEARVKELGCVIASWSPYPVSVSAGLATASTEQPRSISISVSHTRTVGGFALLSSNEGTIGFDIEDISRVRESVIKRMANPDSDDHLFPPHLLWVAKEASFKSLRGPSQPAVLSDVGLVEIENLNEKTRLFKIKLPKHNQGLGLTLEENSHALCIFILKRST